MLDNHGFDMWAGAYDRAVENSDNQDKYPFAGYGKLMNAIYGTVMRNCPAKVLDVGIGTGTLAARLYENGNHITGIDFSDEMLNRARAKMPNAKLYRADFSKGLPPELREERFDFIVCTYAIHHLADGEKAKLIRALCKHLNAGAVIMIGDVSFTDRESLEACRQSSGDAWDGDEFYFVFSELKELLRGDCELTYHQYSYCSGILEVHA